MSDAFTGYNLKFSLASNNSFASIGRKSYTIDRTYTYSPNIITTFIEHKDNSLGTDAFMLYQNNVGATLLNYGIIRSKDKLP